MKEKNYPENTQNLLELLTEFFNFYSYSDKGAFRKYHMKVNIKTGQICFLNTLTQFYENSEKHYMFSIEDPFDRRHNPGDRVKKADKISEIKYKIDSTIMSLEKKNYKKERYKEFFKGT